MAFNCPCSPLPKYAEVVSLWLSLALVAKRSTATGLPCCGLLVLQAMEGIKRR